jgi:hypothetical protein
LDIWKGLKGLGIEKFSARNSFWFAHPVYFLNNLDKAGLFNREFNPYAGRLIEPRFHQDIPRVVSSPGFAPAHENGSSKRDPDRFDHQDSENSNLYWAKVNLIANKPYPQLTTILPAG